MRGIEETVAGEAMVTFLVSAAPTDPERRTMIHISFSHGRCSK